MWLSHDIWIQQLVNLSFDMNNLERWFKRNAIGEKKEAEGKFEDAIRIYEANVEEDADTLFPYERLCILYRRKNDRYNEKRILQKAIGRLNERARLGALDENLENQRKQLKIRLKELNGNNQGGKKKKWFSK